MPDVEATSGVFPALLHLGTESSAFTSLEQLRKIAGITPRPCLRTRPPGQEGLFEL